MGRCEQTKMLAPAFAFGDRLGSEKKRKAASANQYSVSTRRKACSSGLGGREMVVATLDSFLIPNEAVNVDQQKVESDVRPDMVAGTR
jgi:hypothetical protein